MTDEFTKNVYGSLIGGAIGDALGATVEGWTHERINSEYGKVDGFQGGNMPQPYANTPPGAITSDSTLRHYLCLSIVQNNGRVTPDEFAETLVEYLNRDRVWINEEIVINKLVTGMNPWETGRGSVPDNKITSAITPVGIINACDPNQAYQDAFNIASMFQESLYRDATGTVAAGIAEALAPDATIDSVLEVMMKSSSSVFSRILDIIIDITNSCSDIEEFTEVYYDDWLDWRWPAVNWDTERYFAGEVFSASIVECVPVAMAILVLCDGIAKEAIIKGVNFGRDSDAIATLAGSIAGALKGAESLPDVWIDQVEQANRDFFEEIEDDSDLGFASMAERLVGALESERDALEARTALLDELL